jgi:hypothetical protein
MFSDSDFKHLSFQINKAKSGTLPHGLPETKLIDSWWSCNRDDKDKVIRYIVLVYDKASPLVKRFTNLEHRKRHALAMAGFQVDDPTLTAYTEFKDEEFTNMVIDFLIYQSDYVWMMLVSNEQTFYEFQKTLLQESAMIRNDKDKITAIASKAKLMEESDNIVARVNDYRKQVFGEEKLIETSKRVASSPEEMAKML